MLNKLYNRFGMILEMKETCSMAMKVNLRCIKRAKMKVTSLVLMPLHQGKIVMMKLRVVEIVEIVVAKGRQDDKKLLLFGEWHMEQHRVTFPLQETLECRYRLKIFSHTISLLYLSTMTC